MKTTAINLTLKTARRHKLHVLTYGLSDSKITHLKTNLLLKPSQIICQCLSSLLQLGYLGIQFHTLTSQTISNASFTRYLLLRITSLNLNTSRLQHRHVANFSSAITRDVTGQGFADCQELGKISFANIFQQSFRYLGALVMTETSDFSR